MRDPGRPEVIDPGEVVLLNQIGAGGIADVWLGDWRGAQVAVKVLRRTDHAGLRRRFVREGQLLHRLTHPGIVTCYGVIDGDKPALVLELLKGEPLDRRLTRSGALGAVEGEALAAALLRTLDHLHARGIVHRDIKAGNVWWGVGGRVVLMDLGLAVDPSDPLTSTLGQVVGTHAYMAPEQIAGSTIDLRCDLYSLGVTLYEALSGTRPYRAKGVAGYLAAHRSARAVPLPERRPDLPRRLTELVGRLMARDPAARPGSAAVALVQLQAEPPAARGLERPRPVGREAARGAVAAVVDAGGGVVLHGPVGSGLRSAAELVAQVAAEESVEVLRVRAGGGPLPVALARALGPFVGAVAPEAAEVELVRLGAEGRLVVLVEEGEALDPEARALLGRAAAAPGVGVVVVARAPTTFPGARLVPLRPLRPEETTRLVASMLRTTAVPPGLDAALHRVGGGLPGWSATLLRDAWERGALTAEGSDASGRPAWRWAAERMVLDPGAVIVRRLAHLPDESRAVLDVVAVAAGALPLRVVLQAAGADPSGLAVGHLVREGILALPEGDDEVLVPRPSAALDAARSALAEADVAELRARIRAAAGDWVGHDGVHGIDIRLAEADLAEGRPDRALVALGPGVAEAPLLRVRASLALGRVREARQAMPPVRGPDVATLAVWDAAVELASGRGLPTPLAQVVRRRAEEGDEVAVTLVAELSRRAGDVTDALERLDAPASTLDLRVARAVERVDLLLLRGDIEGADAALEGLAADAPILRAWLDAARAQVDLARGRLAAVITTLRRPWPTGAVGAALQALVELELDLALGPDHATRARLADLDTLVAPLPWGLRRRYHRVAALVRLGAKDTPAAVDALLAGADETLAAGDTLEHALHNGLAALLTAREERVGEAVERLAAADVPRLQALLLAHGARHTGDPEVVIAAESAARAAGDSFLLLRALFMVRGEGARDEAAALCRAALEGLPGRERDRLLARASVGWALGRHSGA